VILYLYLPFLETNVSSFKHFEVLDMFVTLVIFWVLKEFSSLDHLIGVKKFRSSK